MQRFGVPQLDRLLPSIPTGASLVLVHEPGIEADPFLYQSADAHLREGRPVVYVVLSRAPSSVLRSMRAYGFQTEGRLEFLDGYSGLMGSQGDSKWTLRNPADPEELIATLERIHRERPDATLLIDPLSMVADHATFPLFRAAFPRILQAMKRFPLSAALFTRWPYAEDLAPMLSTFDGVVRLRAVEDRVLISQYFTVERVGWAEPPPARPVLYRALKPGGVFAYIPKIVVTGPFHAGKTTFVQTISDVAVSVNRLGTTVALDHGHVTLDGLNADIFGTPGQERFDPILRIISGQALGIVLVVDSTQPDTFPRAREMMHQTWRQGLPIIVAANKQDAPDALAPDEVARLLKAPNGVRVVGCRASVKDDCLGVLRGLIAQIMGGAEVPA